MTPAEHDALAQVRDEVLKMLPFRLPAGAVEDVIGFLGVLVADPGTRPAVLVALGLGGEGR